MNILVPLLCLSLALPAMPVYAAGPDDVPPDQDAPVYEEKLPALTIVTELPGTAVDSLKSAFSKDAIPGWALILATTGITFHYDEDLLQGAQATGRRWGLSNEDHTKTVLGAGEINLLRLPTDAASGLYFLGDGWTDFVAAGAFLATGYFSDYSRPWNTGIQLVHGMTLSAVVVQGAKRAFGRETANEQTEPGGKWRPFPSSDAYTHNTAMYDAMPSGHVMTTTLVFTIIRENYPEYDHWLFPLELGYLTVLGFAMLNNGVHWASDYPLGAGMGYVMGKASTRMLKRHKEKNRGASAAADWMFFPSVHESGVTTMNAMLSF